MIIKVDGWLYRVPADTAFIEFASSDDKSQQGTFRVLDEFGAPLKVEGLGLPTEVPWTERVPR